MKIPRLITAMSYIDDDLISEAEEYKPETRQTKKWVMRFTAMAACFCIVAVGVEIMQQKISYSSTTLEEITPEQTYVLSEPAVINVEIVEWTVDGFKAIVVDACDNAVFPDNAELTVRFDEDTSIIAANGNIIEFDPDEPDTSTIGWTEGTIVQVEFTDYDEYLEGNHFYNQLYADIVKQCN